MRQAHKLGALRPEAFLRGGGLGKNPVGSGGKRSSGQYVSFGNKPLLSLVFSRIMASFWAQMDNNGQKFGPINRANIMKDGIHPNYREVVFLDTSCDFGFVTRSTVATNETIKWKDGKEYPVYKIEISAESHPFYTGKQKIVDTAGRVDKFKKRYARKSSSKAAE